MAYRIDDRWLWLGFGVFLFAAAKGIQYAITDIVQLTEIKKPTQSGKKKGAGEQVENSISINSLRILATSPNPNISNAAISLIVSRIGVTPGAMDSILTDKRSDDESTRRRAQTAIDFMQDWETPIGGNTYAVPDSPVDRDHDFASDHIWTSHGLLESEVGEFLDPSLLGPPDWPAHLRSSVRRNTDTGIRDGPSPHPLSNVTNASSLPSSPETRRQRREAMVLHEGEGEVDADDIIGPVR